MRSLRKCVPLSLTRIFGNPNVVMIFSYMKAATCAAVSILTALASAHLVKYLVAIIMYAIPLEEWGWTSPTYSIPYFSKGTSDKEIYNDISILRSFLAYIWQTSHFLT